MEELEEEFEPFTTDLEDMQIVLSAVRMVAQIENSIEPEDLETTTFTVNGRELYEILELFLAFTMVYEGVDTDQLVETENKCLELGACATPDTVH